MVILGVDPGIALTGYGVVQVKPALRVLGFGAIETTPALTIAERLERLFNGLSEIIQHYQPTELAVEELFFNRNTRTAITVGQARGVIILAAARAGLAIHEYTPLEVKQAVVGYGRAEKRQVQLMVRSLLGLPQIPKPDDVADALAIAVCHAHSYRLKQTLMERNQ
ncbi:MAG: crossover junction endodeoxyribonuclease RuvC [Firmicutes bacterium]|nr:crossover junction endodeoxyribonuclease RuvC [Bacillota bacterium]